MRCRRRPSGRWFRRLVGLVEVAEEEAELVEAFGAELLCPGVFHFGDGLADDGDRLDSASGEGDAFGASVVGVGVASEVAALLELSE